MTTPEIRALLDLIQDENPAVVAAVCDRLVTLGDEAMEHLRAACDDPDPQRRLRARSVHARLRADRQAQELEALIESADFELERAAVLLASFENPEVDAVYIHAELDRLAELVSVALASARGSRERALVLGQVLHDQEGFVGNARDYYDPRNSYLDDVLRRRLGIPISLSCLYMLVGRRLGLDLVGVGMPTHFLTLFREDGDELLIDPFGGGRLMTREACRTLLAGYRHRFRDEYLRPVCDRKMLRRMMANLIHVYNRRNDESRLARLYRVTRTLQENEDRA